MLKRKGPLPNGSGLWFLGACHAAKPSEWHYESKSKKMRRRVHGKWQYRNPTDSERDEAERELMDRTW
jgi:hypothetical protein